jgi:hypothetical protein
MPPTFVGLHTWARAMIEARGSGACPRASTAAAIIAIISRGRRHLIATWRHLCNKSTQIEAGHDALTTELSQQTVQIL